MTKTLRAIVLGGSIVCGLVASLLIKRIFDGAPHLHVIRQTWDIPYGKYPMAIVLAVLAIYGTLAAAGIVKFKGKA